MLAHRLLAGLSSDSGMGFKAVTFYDEDERQQQV